jgi:hypothetical protein
LKALGDTRRRCRTSYLPLMIVGVAVVVMLLVVLCVFAVVFVVVDSINFYKVFQKMKRYTKKLDG